MQFKSKGAQTQQNMAASWQLGVLLFGFTLMHSCVAMPSPQAQNFTEVIGNYTFTYPGDAAMYTKGLFEGDIKGGMGIVKDENGKDTYAAIIPGFLWTFWPNNILYFQFHSSVSAANRVLVLYSMAEITQQTSGCIRFVDRNGNKAISNYVLIRSDKSGCNSYVGRRRLFGSQELSLEANGCMWKGTVIHELMHALGFHHEQSRPDRDNYVRIQLENLEDGGDAGNFKMHSTSKSNTYGTPYDIWSIMQYPVDAFAKPGTLTMVPIGIYANVDWTKIGHGNYMGPQDIALIKKAYNCY